MSGGGGGQSATTTSGLDPDIKRRALPVLDDVGARYREEAQDTSRVVADLSPDQQRALQAQRGLGEQALTGTGLYNTDAELQRNLQRVSGQQQGAASRAGALGSARAQAAEQQARHNVALDDLEQRRAYAQQGAQQIGDVGSTFQQQKQKQLDAPHTAASRYFGYLTGTGGQQSTTQQGGGK